MGWIADFFRLAWGFLYWNTRKSVYRLRGARGRCPCHHPSDSGRAWETACAAITHWNDPTRFQRLCPLLQKNPAGAWRCTADRADVRPFWGRAAIFYASTLGVVYLAAALTAFTFLRTVGYAVTFPGVLWPPAWEKFTGIRSRFFLQKFDTASRAGDMQTALMSLSTAYSLEPQNYSAGRQLARLWQTSQPLYSNQIYRRLINDHPDQAEITAQEWFRALLARGDFQGVESLAAERILASPVRAEAWLNAFLFANHRTGDSRVRRQLAEHPSLPVSARFLLTLSGDLASLPQPGAARARLITAASGAGDGLSLYQVCRELIARGFAQDALDTIDRRTELLGTRDLLSLRLAALAALGWCATLQSEVENLLIAPPAPVVVELLSAHLIRYPDADLRSRVFARIEASPLPADQAGFSAYLALFCAAGAGLDAPRVQWTADRIHTLLGNRFHGLETVGDSLLATNHSRLLENYLPLLQPLSLEVTYALFDHYAPVR